MEHGRTQTFPLRFDLQSVGRVLVVEAGDLYLQNPFVRKNKMMGGISLQTGSYF